MGGLDKNEGNIMEMGNEWRKRNDKLRNERNWNNRKEYKVD